MNQWVTSQWVSAVTLTQKWKLKFQRVLRPNRWHQGLGLINKLLLYWLWVSSTHDSLAIWLINHGTSLRWNRDKQHPLFKFLTVTWTIDKALTRDILKFIQATRDPPWQGLLVPFRIGGSKTQVTFHRSIVAGHCFTFLKVTQNPQFG